MLVLLSVDVRTEAFLCTLVQEALAVYVSATPLGYASHLVAAEVVVEPSLQLGPEEGGGQ